MYVLFEPLMALRRGQGGMAPNPALLAAKRTKIPHSRTKIKKTYFDFKQEKKQEGKESMHPINN